MSILRTEVLPFKATAFKDGDFINISEADLHGKWSVVFFYPADFTFVCPTELEDLAEHYEEFQKRGVEIYSVSTDTHFTHMAWHGSSPAVGKVRLPSGELGRMVRKMPALPFLLVVEVVEYRFLLAKRQQLGIRLVVVHLAVNGPLVLSAFLDRAELGRPP